MDQMNGCNSEFEALLDQFLLPDEKIDFLGEIPCPVKLAFKEKFDDYCAAHPRAFSSYIPTTCGLENTEPGQQILKTLLTGPEDALPDLVVSFGLRDFFEQPLLTRLLNPERCSTPVPFPIARPYADLEIQDPEGVFTVFSILPMVMIADLRRLGDLPLPESWGDLLDPKYKGMLCCPPGEEGSIEALPLLHFYRNFGDDGLRRLAENIGELTCGSKVAMKVGTGRSDTKPISVITWFFANAALKNGGVKLILPKDGAFVNPVYLASSRTLTPELERLRAFLLGDEMAAVWDENFYPAIDGNILSKIPPDMTFQWMGWDFIRGCNIKDYIRNLQRKFAGYLRETHPEWQ